MHPLEQALRAPVLEAARRQHRRLSDQRPLEDFSGEFELNAQDLGVRFDAQAA